MNTNETIAAICTGLGGAISIVRLSGDGALSCAEKIWAGGEMLRPENARKMLLGKTVSSGGGEPALAVFMPGPRSYTGEDIVEIHCHGGALSARSTLDAAVRAGARHAEPGEFTYRAFVNGKMDLTQAEAVADVISAHSSMALRLAERQMSGLLKNKVEEIRAPLVDILSEVESRLDFPEEDLDWSDKESCAAATRALGKKASELLGRRLEGAVLRNGIRVVIAGRPNVGKSSLMNLLLGYDRAIVTTIPGTTRDTLEEYATLRGIPARLTDTAGIREAEDIIEGMGIERSKESMRQAQVILWLLDASSPDTAGELDEMRRHIHSEGNIITLWNKTDMLAGRPLPDTGFPTAKISVRKNSGVEEFLDLFEKAVWGHPHTEEPETAVGSRHAALLEEALPELDEAAENILAEDWELAASSLRAAIKALGTITGEDADPDVLENIFSRFCIGK